MALFRLQVQQIAMSEALREYYLYRNGYKPKSASSSSENIEEILTRMSREHAEHLREQDLLLEVIRQQSKPQFGREVLANVVGNAITDGAVFLIKSLCKM